MWTQRARLWRLILLQRPEGFFDCTEGIALALGAQLHSELAGGLGGDCPITFQTEAVRQTVPDITVDGDELNDEEGKLRIWVRCRPCALGLCGRKGRAESCGKGNTLFFAVQLLLRVRRRA